MSVHNSTIPAAPDKTAKPSTPNFLYSFHFVLREISRWHDDRAAARGEDNGG